MTLREFFRKLDEADRRWPMDRVIGGILGALLLFILGFACNWWE